jgi:hypothetical protein
LLWAAQWGTTAQECATDVAVDASGDVLVVGTTGTSCVDSFDFSREGFVRKLRGSDGTLLWSAVIGTTVEDIVNAVGVDDAGNVLVAGRTRGAFVGQNAGQTDVFVRAFDTSGAELWTRQFGNTGYDYVASVAAASDGDPVIAGQTTSSLGAALLGTWDGYVVRIP